MAKAKVALTHGTDLGSPGEYTREQLDNVKAMIKEVVDGSMGGMQNIVKKGQKVLIKINTVVPCPPGNGFTTDPRILEALIELIKEQEPTRIQIGERCANNGDTMTAMIECGIKGVADRTGAELVPFENEPYDMYKIDRPIAFNEFPVPKPINDCDVYIGLPKMKVHIHTGTTGALKLQFGNLPNYEWMCKCHRDDIFQKIVNLTRASKATWFLADSLYSCQGNGPFSPFPDDLVKDFNVMYAGSDPVAVDTVMEALMDWENPGRNAPAAVLAAAEGLGTNKLEEIEVVGKSIDSVKRKFKKQETILNGAYPEVNVIVGSACEPGCRVLVRMALDACYVDGTLGKLKKPLHIITGLQFDPLVTKLDGDVIIYGECAKKMCQYFPDAKFYGSTEEYPGCAPTWSNVPGIGLADYIRSLV